MTDLPDAADRTAPRVADAPPLTEVLVALLRFAALMLRAGDTAFRVRQWMGAVATAMGVQVLAVHVNLGGMTATARRDGETVTLATEVGPLGINASRIAALEQLARGAEPGLAPATLASRLDAIEAVPPLHTLALTALAVGGASGAFSYLNGGGPVEVAASCVGGGLGQLLRSLLLRRRINQYAVTALCAVLASGVYCLVAALIARAGIPVPRQGAGFISSVLFLVPGFPLVAGLLDLLQHQTVAGIARLAYGALLVAAAGLGLSLVAAAAGLTPDPPPPLPLSEATTVLLRAVASLVGGCGFAILYNSPWRTALSVAGLALLGIELRLGLHDAGVGLAQATLVGALAVGLAAALVRRYETAPRISLTVPGIIMMVPGTYAFQTIVQLNDGDVAAAIQSAALGGFAVGAMALGLTTARFLTERKWLTEA